MFICRLPPVVMIHFVEGVPGSCLREYDFTYRGATYKVSGVVQYRTHPNHFVAWINNKGMYHMVRWGHVDEAE